MQLPIAYPWQVINYPKGTHSDRKCQQFWMELLLLLCKCVVCTCKINILQQSSERFLAQLEFIGKV